MTRSISGAGRVPQPMPGRPVGGAPQAPAQAAPQAPAQAPPANAQTATQAQANAPGEQPAATATGKRGRKPLERIDYPLLTNPAGERVKLAEAPKDFSARKHNALKAEDFADVSIFFNWKADEYEAKSKDMRRRADDARRLGGVADQKKAKKFLDLRARFARMAEELGSEGVDVSALLEAADQQIADAVAPPAGTQQAA